MAGHSHLGTARLNEGEAGDSHLDGSAEEGWWETVTWDGSAEEGWRETVTWDGSAEEGWRETVTWAGLAEEGWWETVTWTAWLRAEECYLS